MKVYGYDSAKTVFCFEMAPHQVVRKKIHPWRLDLFDANPVMTMRRGREIFFSRLDNISFAYLVENPNMFKRNSKGKLWSSVCLGQVLNGTAACCQGKLDGDAISECISQMGVAGGLPRIIDFATAPFAQSWLHYLTLSPQGKEIAPDVYAANSCPNVLLRRGAFKLIQDCEIGRPVFTGEMFAKIRLALQLPLSLNAVFTHFRDWQPIIYGGALRDLLAGERFNNVNFMIAPQTIAAKQARLEEIGATKIVACEASASALETVFQFKLNGTHYQMIANSVADNFWQINDFSVTQVIAAHPNEIIASRICLWDIGQRQARQVSTSALLKHKCKSACFSSNRTQTLRARGYQILADVFSL